MFLLKSRFGVRQSALIGLRSMHATAAQPKINVEGDQNNAAVRPFSEVPRPGKLKFLCSFMPGGENRDKSFMEFTMDMRKKYGDLFLMPGAFGREDTLVAFNTKDIEMVFRNEGIWPQRDNFESIVYFREHVRPEVFAEKKGLIATQHEEWGKFRSAVNPIFMQPKGLKVYYQPLSNINNEFIERIKEIRDPKTLEVPKNFEEEIARLIFESIAYIAFNREMGIIRKRRDNPEALSLFKSSRDVFRHTFKLDIQPSIWKFVSTPTYRKMVKSLNESVDVGQAMIEETRLEREERRMAGEDIPRNSMMERLMDIDPKIALVMGLDILLAGVDVTSTFLSGLLLCLSKNQEKQNKLREELLQIMPTKDTLLDEERMKNMPYLRAVIKEAMRYYPFGVGTFRKCAVDVTLSGFNIPKGTNVLLGSNAMMKDEKYFSRANEFLPERWLRDPETNRMTQISPFTFLPFGYGPRMCIGKRVVDLEIETAVAKIVRNFYVEFNYDASKPYTSHFVIEPAIPFQFKFSDVEK